MQSWNGPRPKPVGIYKSNARWRPAQIAPKPTGLITKITINLAITFAITLGPTSSKPNMESPRTTRAKTQSQKFQALFPLYFALSLKRLINMCYAVANNLLNETELESLSNKRVSPRFRRWRGRHLESWVQKIESSSTTERSSEHSVERYRLKFQAELDFFSSLIRVSVLIMNIFLGCD